MPKPKPTTSSVRRSIRMSPVTHKILTRKAATLGTSFEALGELMVERGLAEDALRAMIDRADRIANSPAADVPAGGLSVTELNKAWVGIKVGMALADIYASLQLLAERQGIPEATIATRAAGLAGQAIPLEKMGALVLQLFDAAKCDSARRIQYADRARARWSMKS